MMITWIAFVAFWAALTRHSFGVRISELNVPGVALEGDDVHLRCDYKDEGGSSLYTLKWYKDGKEFFRHQPGITPHSTDDKCADEATYSVDGVQVECWVSTERDVVLQSVSQSTTGVYRCEVIGEHPTFRKEYKEARLVVYKEELQTPVVTGNEESYRTFDTISLNCSSANSEYRPDISWMVNGHKAPSEVVIKYGDQPTEGIRFTAENDLFRRGIIEVTCVTSMGAFHTRSNQVQLTNRDYQLSAGYYYNTGLSRVIVSEGCILSCLLFSVYVLFPFV